MVVSEIYEQTANLGFDDFIEKETWFYHALNRAIMEIQAIRPKILPYILYHHPLANLIGEDTFSPIERASDLCFSAQDPRAYYFESNGTGVALIEKRRLDGSWSVIGSVEMSSPERVFIPYRGFVEDGGDFTDGEIRLRFTGKYLYAVKHVVMYGAVFSDSVSDIPAYGPYCRYVLPELIPSFLSMEAPPILENEEYAVLHRDYELEGGSTILFPSSARGCFRILYRSMPQKLEREGNADEDHREIDLDEELCTLLPLLVAHYVWMEDEPAIATQYLSLYQTRALDIERRAKSFRPAAFQNKTGW